MSLTFSLKVVHRACSSDCDFTLIQNGIETPLADGNLPYSEKLISGDDSSYKQWSEQFKIWADTKRSGHVNSTSSFDPLDQESLVDAAANLEASFQNWVDGAGLEEIRTKIRDAAQAAHYSSTGPIYVFLSCEEIAHQQGQRQRSQTLERLPWEDWNWHLPENVPPTIIQISRTVRKPTAEPAQTRLTGKLRLLVIVADDPNLDFERHVEALQALKRSSAVSLEQVRIKDEQRKLENRKAKPSELEVSAELEELVKQKIAGQPGGWDGLIFIGHADEWNGDSFELCLRNNTKLLGHDLEPAIEKAIQQGLRCAIFIACNGSNIGYRLTQLGLHQVLVMREPINLEAARFFTEVLCKELSNQRDIRSAMQKAKNALKAEENTYLSTYLIPSLFCHPDPTLQLFQIEPSRLKRWWKDWQPRPWECYLMSTLLVSSFMIPVQDLLLDVRMLTQAVYRDKIGLLPASNDEFPPVALIEITQEAIDRDIGADNINPMDRAYLAKLIDALADIRPRVVGLNYFLNAPMTEPRSNEDPILARSINQVLSQKQPWLIFATGTDQFSNDIGVTSTIIDPIQRFTGNTTLGQTYPWKVDLSKVEDCNTTNTENPSNCPFPYFLAQSVQVVTRLSSNQQEMERFFDPALRPKQPMQNRLVDQFSGQGSLETPRFQRSLQHIWAYPIIDYSIPPKLAYTRISSTDLLDHQNDWLEDTSLKHLNQQIVIIASGGYIYAEDNFSVPLAMRYWQGSDAQPSPTADTTPRVNTNVLTGGQLQAYVTSQWIRQHWIPAIPDVWMLILGFICGKWISIQIKSASDDIRRLQVGGCIGYAFYSLMTLQLYVFPGILLPWFFPTIGFIIYVIPMPRRNNDVV